MDRRNFLNTSFLTLLMAGSYSCNNKIGRKNKLLATDNNTLAGFTLEELHDEYQSDLFNDFLPFLDKYVIDHELGGFMCNTDRDGSRINTDKISWYNGRGVWVYSFLV